MNIIGLTTEQVNERIARGEINKTKNKHTKSYFDIFVRNVFTPINIILLTLFVLLLIVKLYTRILFGGVLFINIFIGVFQDVKAKKLIERISLNSAPKSIVMRNGAELEIPSDNIVLGDIIILKAGMVVPSDCRLISGDIKLNESLLTGESDSIEKKIGDTLYKESAVVSGKGIAEITAVGKNNYINSLESKAKEFKSVKSELLTSVNRILRVLSVIAIALGVIEVGIYIWKKLTFVDIVDTVSSSMVASIPTGMILMVSLALTVGVITLARKGMLVQELYSIENLARVDTLCVDKTGTLTNGEMTVVGKYSNKIRDIVSRILFATQDDNITARALKAHFGISEIKGKYTTLYFDSKTKYSGYELNGNRYIIGAYGFATSEIKWAKLVEKQEELGYRVLCVVVNDKCIGLITLEEHIKEDVATTIDWFKKNDVNIVVISGDSPRSIEKIGNKVGVVGECVSLLNKKDEEVREIVRSKKYNIYGRVTPEQKHIIIEELKKLGHKVAMVGDGINDLLALKGADCSIAMASGSDAIKGASHLVSLDSNFASFPNVVEEGRRVINNLQRICSLFLIKTYFAIIMSIIFIFASLVDKTLTYPFVTNNMLIFELIVIGLCPFFIALEPNRNRVKGNFTKTVLNKTLPAGICLVGCVLITLFIGKVINEYESAIAFSTILISILPFVFLWIICSPPTLYRFVVLLLSTIIGLLCMAFDFMLFKFSGTSLFEIKYTLITWRVGLLSSIVASLLLFAYIYYEQRIRGHLIKEIKKDK